MTIQDLPPAPSPTDDAATFDSKAFTFAVALQTFATEANDLAAQANADAAIAANGANFSATSTTSLTIGTGSKSPTLAQTGKSFQINQRVLISNTADSTKWMIGVITAFNSGTGAMTVNVDTTNGSGTLSSWNVALVPMTIRGLQTIWVPASAMFARVTNGATVALTETTTNKVMLQGFDFDNTTQQFVQFKIGMPKSWNSGTVTFQPLWKADSSTGGVVWSMQAMATGNGDVLDTAFGTEQTSTDTLTAVTDLHIGPVSSAITIAGSPAESDLVHFQVKRNPADASDTLAAKATLLGVKIFYTLKSDNDG